MSAGDLRSTALYDKALGCLAGATLGDAAGAAAKGADCGSGAGSGEQVSGQGSHDVLAFGAPGDETAMVEIVARMLIDTGGGAMLDDWARAMCDHSPQFAKDGAFFISVQQVFSAVGRRRYPPRYTGLGTMPHSTGVVAMGPVGIVNACNPWQAALQAYELATLMHVYDVGFCQDGAAAVAAAVAAACRTDATVASVLDAAVDVILPVSGAEMADLIRQARQLAADTGDFDRFRAEMCGNGDRWLRTLPGDPRETVPVALAIFSLTGGDVQQAITCAARFGRAADAIGCIAGTMSGAFSGAGGISPGWQAKLQDHRGKHETLAAGLAAAARAKLQALRAAAATLRSIAP
ncbi:MAG: ADP-ribosylglycohydrolase family protein [Spirochaetaceae bacterium]|nr:ADP-ribosylglycohydrolase family protein [Spirochaetaceae bacterium]